MKKIITGILLSFTLSVQAQQTIMKAPKVRTISGVVRGQFMTSMEIN